MSKGDIIAKFEYVTKKHTYTDYSKQSKARLDNVPIARIPGR